MSRNGIIDQKFNEFLDLKIFLNSEMLRHMFFRFIFASPENIKEEHKRQLIESGRLDGVVNTELTKIALKNKICYESENSVAGCVSEILSDLLLFHSTSRGEMVWPIWACSNSFNPRLATRIGSRRHAELITMLQLMLPGTSIFYYGQEIGLKDALNDVKINIIWGF